MTVAKSKELSSLVQAGNIDGLTMAVVKWHLQYKDIRVENTPLLHLAVMADNFQMVISPRLLKFGNLIFDFLFCHD